MRDDSIESPDRLEPLSKAKREWRDGEEPEWLLSRSGRRARPAEQRVGAEPMHGKLVRGFLAWLERFGAGDDDVDIGTRTGEPQSVAAHEMSGWIVGVRRVRGREDQHAFGASTAPVCETTRGARPLVRSAGLERRLASRRDASKATGFVHAISSLARLRRRRAASAAFARRFTEGFR